MIMRILLRLLLRIQLDHGIDPHDGDARLDGTLELLDLAHAGLENASLERVMDATAGQVKAVVAVILLLGDGFFLRVGLAFVDSLRERVTHAQLRDEL